MLQKRRNNSPKDKLTIFITFFVIAPLVSISLAYLVVNHVIVPCFIEQKVEIKEEIPPYNATADVHENINNNKDVEIPELEYKINDIGFCSVQVGSFNDINNAKTIIQDMKNNNIAGFIVKIKDSYKVYSGVFTNEEHARKHKEELKKNYNDAFISSNLMSGGVVKYTQEEEKYVEAFAKVIDCFTISYESESISWLEALKTHNKSIIIKSLQENNKKIRENIKIMDNEKSDNIQLKDVKENIAQNLQKREELVAVFEATNIVEAYNQYSKCMVDYLNMIKLN